MSLLTPLIHNHYLEPRKPSYEFSINVQQGIGFTFNKDIYEYTITPGSIVLDFHAIVQGETIRVRIIRNGVCEFDEKCSNIYTDNILAQNGDIIIIKIGEQDSYKGKFAAIYKFKCQEEIVM